ncbi:MAG: esterase-like activity of phytase family protein [Vicinamibacterales bacterium]
MLSPYPHNPGAKRLNRGFEGLAITPDGERLVGVLQDPLVNEPGPNNGRDGRNVRIVVFDNDRWSPSYGTAVAQYAYQLEKQTDIAARIIAAGGTATATDPRQGRNIGLSAIVAINQTEFLVLERDNRGIGVDDSAGTSVVGSKRVYKIDISGATDVTDLALPLDALPANVIAVSKSPVFIDLATNTVLPNGKIAEKWEGLAIGPRLKDGARAILVGNDNDYSVTQSGPGTQFDIYVNFTGGTEQRDLDQPTRLNGIEVGPVPDGYSLLPGVLHAYRVLARICRLTCRRRVTTTERCPLTTRQEARHETVTEPSSGLNFAALGLPHAFDRSSFQFNSTGRKRCAVAQAD